MLLAVIPSLWCCAHPGASINRLLPGGGSSDSVVDSGVEDSGIADGDPGDDRDPVWSADEAAEHFVWILSQGFPTPMTMWVHIEALVANGDEDCPGEESSWYLEQGGCLSSTGYLYRGELYVEGSESSDQSSTVQTLESSLAVFTIGTPQGDDFRMSSHWAQRIEHMSNGDRAGSLDFVGSVEYPPADEPWLSETTSMTGMADARSVGSDEGAALYVGGQFSLGWGLHAIRLDDVSYASDSCETWPIAGSIEVWSPEGIWARADFDEDCACPSWIDAFGNDLGESCVDLSPAFEAIATDMQVSG